ncbi:MAG: hypothetical protein GY809_25620 [Planctomycetes bacterium]|nr:hypothetical protein [Planctomycetota bacterium]
MDKCETGIELPVAAGLKPGVSADVEVMIELHEDALTLPVNGILQTAEGTFCWVHTVEGSDERRTLQLGDTDGESVVIEAGLQAGDEVVLDPLTCMAQAQALALTPFDRTTQEVDHVE